MDLSSDLLNYFRSRCRCVFPLSATCLEIQLNINFIVFDALITCFKMSELNVEDWKLNARVVVKLNRRKTDGFLFS